MLKSITLENYKCFKDETKIDIAPLTVLCGVNSSGKSSILKSLLMLKQSYENASPYNEMTFNGRLVDNGYFDDIVYHDEAIIDTNKKKYNEFTISNTFLLKNPEKYPNKRQDMQSFKEIKKIFFLIQNIERIEIEISITVIRNDPKDAQVNYYVENNKIQLSKITLRLYNSSDKLLKESYVSIKKYGNDERTYLLKYGNIPYLNNEVEKYEFKTDNKGVRCTCYFSNMHLRNIYKEKMEKLLISLKPSILSIFDIASWQYDGIEFIAPLRQQPQRNYIIRGNIDSVGIDGSDTPVLLAKNFNKDVISDMFISTLEDDDKVIDEYGQIKEKFNTILQQWLDFLHLGKLEINSNDGLVSINISGHNISDVGFGVSQILPIITQGLCMYKDETLLLEQPEIHLHPQIQLNMADFLITLAKHERNIVLETHSDHIVNRIIRRIMEDPSLVDDKNPTIRIVFLDKEDVSPTITNIQVDKYKGVINGNKNFFTQFGFEQLEIAKKGYENHKKDMSQ